MNHRHIRKVFISEITSITGPKTNKILRTTLRVQPDPYTLHTSLQGSMGKVLRVGVLVDEGNLRGRESERSVQNHVGNVLPILSDPHEIENTIFIVNPPGQENSYLKLLVSDSNRLSVSKAPILYSANGSILDCNDVQAVDTLRNILSMSWVQGVFVFGSGELNAGPVSRTVADIKAIRNEITRASGRKFFLAVNELMTLNLPEKQPTP